MSRRGVSDRMHKAPIRRIRTKIKEIKVRTTGITTEKVTTFELATTTAIITSIGVTMVTETIEVGLMFHLKIRKLLLGMVEVV